MLKQVNHFYLYPYAQQRVKFLYLVTRCKKAHVYTHNFSVSLFSSSGTHQSHHLDGCQAMGGSSSFIFAFWAFHFLLSLCGFFLTAFIFCFLKLSGTYLCNHGPSLTALLHIFCFLKLSGTYFSNHESSSTTLSQISWILYWSGTYTNDHTFS